MSKDDNAPGPDNYPSEAAPPRKKLPIKTIGVVGGLMLAEAAGVFLVVGALKPKPTEAEAAAIHGEHEQNLDEIVEIPLVEDLSIQNMQTGRVWGWKISVYLEVKVKNEEFVVAELSRRDAAIREGVSMIFRAAPLSQLKEPGLETLHRQITAYVNKVIPEADDAGSRVERVLIPKCQGMPLE